MNFGWFLILNIEIKQHMHTNKDVDEQMLSIYQNMTNCEAFEVFQFD